MKRHIVRLLVFMFLTVIVHLNAQDIAAPPLFRAACNLDSNCTLYKNLGITVQVDSVFEKGKYKNTSESHYNDSGFLVKNIFSEAAYPGWAEVTEYRYNAHGNCWHATETELKNGDTMLRITRDVLYDDTVTRHYAYQLTYFTPTTMLRDTTVDYLVTRYTNTEAHKSIGIWYPNRAVISGIDSGTNGPVNVWLHMLRNDDSLYRVQYYHGGIGSRDTFDFYTVVDPHTRVYLRKVSGRVQETITWKDGKVTEHHRYVDSLDGLRVWKTTVYDQLTDTSKPELLVMHTDSATMVKKGDQYPYLHYGDPPVYADSVMKESPPEFPQFNDYFTYHIDHKLANGHTQTDYFNPYSGSALPLFRIWIDERGVAYRFEENGMIIIRHTR